MAPILKEAEVTVPTAAATAPAAPLAKAPTEAPARPQPVPLEIAVTVNGARTVEGSDKREPFSESTQTVLVFPLGAVIRMATPLVPGQLIFLTNEKTKKEIVCQVVKSKPSGAAAGYVELKFTEPAAGFWGLPVSAASFAPVAPRPTAPVIPAASKAIPTAPPLPATPVAPKPVTTSAIFIPPAKPEVAPPPLPAAKTEPALPHSSVSVNPVPHISVVPPPPMAAVPVAPSPKPTAPAAVPPEVSVTLDGSHTPSQPVASVLSPASVAHNPATPAPAIHDYSKEISALFLPPQAPPAPQPVVPAVPTANPAPASSAPSAEELKLEATRLQAQLSTLLFRETPAAPPVLSVPPVPTKAATPAADDAKKVLEIVQDEPQPVVKGEPKPAFPVRKPTPAPLSANQEVTIPAWLAPLTQNSESAVAGPEASIEVSRESASHDSVNPEESPDVLVANKPHHQHSSVFGGQLLGEFPAQLEEVASKGSKKGLFLGLAAVVFLIIGGGAWYFRQNLTALSPVAAVKPASSPSSAPVAPKSDLPAASVASTPPPSTVNSAPTTSSPASSQPSKNSAPAPIQVAAAPASEPKNSNSASRNPAPADAPKKPVLGDVHLATPVVSRGANSQQMGDALPAIETNNASAGADLLAVAASARGKEPAVPRPVGGDVKPAQLIKSVPPTYPQVAKMQRISGNVQIDALIDASGNVAAVQVLSGPAILHRAALDAVRQWKYSPALLDGQPTSMHLTVTVQFRAQ